VFLFKAPSLALGTKEGQIEPIEIVSFAYPPYITMNNDGMAQKIANAVFSAAGIPTSMKIYPHARAQKLFQSGQGAAYLGTCDSTSVDDALPVELARASISIISYLPEYSSLTVDEIKKLKQLRFGEIRGATLFGPLGLDPQFYDTNIQILKKLQLNRLDFGAMIELTGRNLIAEHFPKDEFHFRTLFEFEGQICFRNTESGIALQETFVKSFSTIQISGEYREIIESYYIDKNVPERVFISSD